MRVNPTLVALTWTASLVSFITCQGVTGTGPPAGSNGAITICGWSQIRGAVMRDTLYLDGGKMTLVEPNYPPWTHTGNSFDSTMYTLSFSQGFDLSKDNLTALFVNFPYGPAPDASYYSGFLFADDYVLWLYGGLSNPSVVKPQGDDYVWGYEVYNTGETAIANLGEISPTSLTSPVTRYLTDGAGVNIPSEKGGFYFSGMTARDANTFDGGTAQLNTSQLLQVDMSSGRDPYWNFTTLDLRIVSRADAELVWLPVGTNGTLIVIGGVIYPEQLFADSLSSTQITESERISPTFMTQIPVYDIANGRWYIQNIGGTDHPPQLAQFCSVVTYQKNSPSPSWEIFIYGGYDGIDPDENGNSPLPNNNVWVLSVPSFTWTKVYSSTETGRFGHFCTTPYPDQMFVIGGQYDTAGTCLNDTIIKIFDLNNLAWQTNYDPGQWSEYTIPSMVAETIKSKPTVSWSEPGLGVLFDTKYTKNITDFYPYKSVSSHKTPIIPIVVGVVGGAFVITCIGCLIWWKKKRSKKAGGIGAAEIQPDEQVNQWRHGVAKTDPSVTTTEVEANSTVNPNTGEFYKPAEAPGDERYHQHNPSSPRPGGFAEAGGGTRRISGGPTISSQSPHSPQSATLVGGAAAEIEGGERYEMDVMASSRGSGDLGTRYRFRDHPFYPLSVSDGEGRSQASGPSYSGPSHSQSQFSRGEASRGAPSPYLMARPGNGNVDEPELPASPVGQRPDHFQHGRNVSSTSSTGFLQVSPPLEQENPITSGQSAGIAPEDDLDRLEAFHTGSPPFRPTHARNLSSLSSGINQLPSPAEELTEEENNRQSKVLSKLPSPVETPQAEERNPLLVNEGIMMGSGAVRVGQDIYSPSSYSRGSTLQTPRSPVNRKPVGGLGIQRVLDGHD